MINYQGLKIYLYRRPLAQVDKFKKGPGNFIIWGYFDWAHLELGNFSLKSFYNNSENSSSRKLSKYKDFEKQSLFAYSKELISSKPDIVQNEKPLLTITEIKLYDPSDGINNKISVVDNHHGNLEKRLTEQFKLKDIDFIIFNSLGQSDFVVVFRSFSYAPLLTVLQSLKEEKSFLPIKSLYSLHGMQINSIGKWEEKECSRVSIFMSLKPGLTKASLEDKIGGIIRKGNQLNVKQTSEQLPSPNVSSYSIFGKYDLEVIIDKPSSVQAVMKLFNREKKAILSSNNAFFQNHINYTRTRWFYQQDHDQLTTENLNPDRGMVELSSKKEKDVSSILWVAFDFIDRLSRHYPFIISNSLRTNLRELLKSFNRIENNEIVSPLLDDEIAEILRVFIQTVLCNMNIPMADIVEAMNPEKKYEKNIIKKINEKDFSKPHIKLKPIQEDSLERGIFQISELLQNWVQANRTVLEGPIYNIHFINSSTKVYICYYKIVEIIQNLLNKNFIGPIDKHPTVNYFTTIHHSDKLKSWLLFPDTSANQQLVSISLDRNSFFSPLKCIPYLLHEIGHYVSHDMKIRNDQFIKTICGDIAKQILYFCVIGVQNEYIQSKLNTTNLGIETEYYKDIINLILKQLERKVIYNLEMTQDNSLIEYQTFESWTGSLKKAIQLVGTIADPIINEAFDRLKVFFNEQKNTYKKDRAQDLAQLENIINDLAKNMDANGDIAHLAPFFFSTISNFSSDKEQYQKFWEDVTQAYLNKQQELSSFSEQIAIIILDGLSERMTISVINTVKSTQEKIGIANYFANNQVYENTDENREAIKEKILFFLKHNRFSILIDLYYDLFIETTADIFMINVLQLPLKEYQSLFKKASTKSYPKSERTIYAQDIRKSIIVKNWPSLTIKTEDLYLHQNKVIKNDFTDGPYLEALVFYLHKVKDKLVSFCEQQSIKDLRDSFYCLKNGEKIDLAKQEIEFIEKYANTVYK